MGGIIGWLFVRAFVVAPGIDEVVVAGGVVVDKKMCFFGEDIGAGVLRWQIAADVEGKEQGGEGGGQGEAPGVWSQVADEDVEQEDQVEARELGEEGKGTGLVDRNSARGGEEEDGWNSAAGGVDGNERK